MATELINILTRRQDESWSEKDRLVFFKTLDRVIKKVWTRRWGSLQPADVIKEAGFSKPPERFNSLDFEAFRNDCWEMIVNGQMKRWLEVSRFKTDKDAINYAYMVFWNFLKNKIDDSMPFWEGRKKQVFGILSNSASFRKTVTGSKTYWMLTENKTNRPASPEQLNRAVAAAGTLNIRYPRDPESKRGPTVTVKDMTTYLQRLFFALDGMVAEADLMEAVKYACGIVPVLTEGLPSQEDGDEALEIFDNNISQKAFKAGRISCSGHDHGLMARDIFNGLTTEMKIVYDLYRLKELKLVAVAKKMNCSIGKVSELNSKITRHILEYFCQDGADYFPGTLEMEMVTDLVGLLILQERKQP
jgi:hypothetical protein